MQEAYRKDVERAFGILQARFAVIRQPARLWQVQDLHSVMKACILLHNLIITDERELPDKQKSKISNLGYDGKAPALAIGRNPLELDQFITDRYNRITDADKHHQLKSDLVQHLWDHTGDSAIT